MKKKIAVIFEGINGAGKSTGIETLVGMLQGMDILKTFEPGTNSFGIECRALLKKDKDLVLTPDAQINMFWASRHEVWDKDALPHLLKDNDTDRCVIFDRSWGSTFAYNVWAQDSGPECESIHDANLKALMARIRKRMAGTYFEIHHVYLDISPELSIARQEGRDGGDHLNQYHGLELLRKVREGYVQFYDRIRERSSVRVPNPPEFVHFINATGTVKEVTGEIEKSFERILS